MPREVGVDNDDLSLIARANIELQAIPDERKEARTDFLPAALRGAAGLVARAFGQKSNSSPSRDFFRLRR